MDCSEEEPKQQNACLKFLQLLNIKKISEKHQLSNLFEKEKVFKYQKLIVIRKILYKLDRAAFIGL